MYTVNSVESMELHSHDKAPYVTELNIANVLFSKGGLSHLPLKFKHIFIAVITSPPLSSVQILLIPACCLLCVL